MGGALPDDHANDRVSSAAARFAGTPEDLKLFAVSSLSPGKRLKVRLASSQARAQIAQTPAEHPANRTMKLADLGF